MEAPKKIVAWKATSKRGKDRGNLWESTESLDLSSNKDPIYIRADIVERLKGYEIMHKDDCNRVVTRFFGKDSVESGCTCGLTELLREME